MSSGVIAAIAGLVVAISALIANLISYLKLKAETAEVRSRAADAERMARRAYQAFLAPGSLTIYDSSDGFSLFDFECDLKEGAAGELALDSSPGKEDDILVINRTNKDGRLVVSLKSYNYKDRPSVIPASDRANVKRMFRVKCEVRVHSAGHTFLPTLKMEGAASEQSFIQRRHRLTPGAWVDIDEHFDVSFSVNCLLRFDDRSISATPSRLEIRNLVVTEREPPWRLLPVPIVSDLFGQHV